MTNRRFPFKKKVVGDIRTLSVQGVGLRVFKYPMNIVFGSQVLVIVVQILETYTILGH